MSTLIVGLILIFIVFFIRQILLKDGNLEVFQKYFALSNSTIPIFKLIIILFSLFFLARTSFVIIDGDKVGHMKKIYFGASMPPGAVIALDGQKGPQAEILPPGFHFIPFVRVLYEIEEYRVTEVPEGMYGSIVANDGKPLLNNQYIAPSWAEKDFEKMLDAEYFLKNGGVKGPQLSILRPGKYRLNSYQFKISLYKATDIPAGFVGVIKSNVKDVEDCKPLNIKVPAKTEDKFLSVSLVKQGCIGIWKKPLNPGRYYLNTIAYNVTLVDTKIQTWNYKGGYTRRYIDLVLTQEGDIKQKERSERVPVPKGAVDSAIETRIEGWLVPQEIRIQVQVEPENASFLVASVGTLKNAEQKVVTPAIRSVTRNICAAEKVLSLIDENRVKVEERIENAVLPEGIKAGITITDVRLVDSAIPPELLIARSRQQLAEQLQETYKKEQIAQQERIKTEKSRATADKQALLVEAEIQVSVARKEKESKRLRGEGDKLLMEGVAKGQKAQANVLGKEMTMQLAALKMILNAVVKNPEIVKVPNILVQKDGAGDGGSLEGAAAILGASNLINSLMKQNKKVPRK